MLYVVLRIPSGGVDIRPAFDAVHAAEIAVEMIKGLGELHEGTTLQISPLRPPA